MKTFKWILLSILFLSITSIPVYAEEETIEVLGVSLKLGVEQSKVLHEFDRNMLLCVGDKELSPDKCNSIAISSATAPAFPFASLYFQNRKLNNVMKYWDESFSDGDIGSFVRALHALLNMISKGQPVLVDLQTTEKIDPGMTQKVIFISKGHKTIHISVNSGSIATLGTTHHTWISLTEELHK